MSADFPKCYVQDIILDAPNLHASNSIHVGICLLIKTDEPTWHHAIIKPGA